MSDFLSKKISDIDLLLSSSSNRTVLTSKFFIKKININDIKYDDSLYHANSDIILNKIKKTNNKLNQLMIIGHNPGLTSLINYLSNIKLYNLPTTGIAIFNFNSKSWNEITSPKYLELDLIKFPSCGDLLEYGAATWSDAWAKNSEDAPSDTRLKIMTQLKEYSKILISEVKILKIYLLN